MSIYFTNYKNLYLCREGFRNFTSPFNFFSTTYMASSIMHIWVLHFDPQLHIAENTVPNPPSPIWFTWDKELYGTNLGYRSYEDISCAFRMNLSFNLSSLKTFFQNFLKTVITNVWRLQITFLCKFTVLFSHISFMLMKAIFWLLKRMK